MNAAHVLKQRIAKSVCFRPLTDVLTRKPNALPGGPHFGSNPYCTELNASQMPRDCPGGMGGFGIDWYIPVRAMCFLCEEILLIELEKHARSGHMDHMVRNKLCNALGFTKHRKVGLDW